MWRSPPDIYHFVDYDLYTKDATVLQPMYEFLGEEFDLTTVNRVLSTKI